MNEFEQMQGGLNAYPSTQYDGSSAKMARTPTLAERLDLAVKQAEEKLASVKEAREIFQRNPDLEKLLNVMQRGLF